MKIIALAIAMLCALSACDDRAPRDDTPRDLPGEPIIDDECPRADGRPCQ